MWLWDHLSATFGQNVELFLKPERPSCYLSFCFVNRRTEGRDIHLLLLPTSLYALTSEPTGMLGLCCLILSFMFLIIRFFFPSVSHPLTLPIVPLYIHFHSLSHLNIYAPFFCKNKGWTFWPVNCHWKLISAVMPAFPFHTLYLTLSPFHPLSFPARRTEQNCSSWLSYPPPQSLFPTSV